MDKESILKELGKVNYPPYSRDIVSFGMVKYIKVDGNKVDIKLFTGGSSETAKKVAEEAAKLLSEKFPEADISMEMLSEDPSKNAEDIAKKRAEEAKKNALKSVKIKIAVASGKGGVGKSTVSVNLARAFEKIFPPKGGCARVGLMDCDIHGPSATVLMKKEYPRVDEDQKIIPPEIGGIKAISIGMLVDDTQPLIWRGPMVASALKQFTNEVKWGDLDIMVFDLPPGTGDAVLSILQGIELDGAVVVTTPNSLAAATALRGAMVFKKADVEILGIVENMSFFEMPDGSKSEIFGNGGAQDVANALGCPVLSQIPIDPSLQTDSPSEKSMDVFDSLAKKILELVKS